MKLRQIPPVRKTVKNNLPSGTAKQLSEMFQRGMTLHQQGHIKDAAEIYKQILKVNPKHFDALHLLGVAFRQFGNHQKALELYERAILINASNPALYNNRGNALKDLKRLDEALLSYDKAIALKSDYAEAYYNRGLTLQDLKRLDEALLSYDKVIALKPDYWNAYNDRSNALKELKRLDEALASYEKAIALKPDYAEAYSNRGVTLQDLKRLEEALLSYDKAIALKPDYAEAYSNRGNALKELKRLDEALASYDKAIALKPDYAEAYYNRGIALQELKRLDEALASYDKAIAMKPDYADAYNNRGNVLRDLKRLDEALASYDKAIALKPDGDFWFGTALHTSMHLCEWKNYDNRLNFILKGIKELKKIASPFTLLALQDSPSMHKVASELFIKAIYPPSQIQKAFLDTNVVSKIRVGYFSADFHDHATMHLLADMFECHDKNRFEFIAFSFGPDTNDEWQNRAINSFTQFIDCNKKSNAEIAKISTDLGIHIAVDLKGFTEDSRTGIFAERAAPVQVNFIGYPGTMGADYIDYIIADEVLIPEESQQFYTEKVAYLPHCYQPNCRIRAVSNKSISRSDFGLPESSIVFSSFNNNYKITPDIFASWIRILKQVDGSVLWLLTTNSTAENNLRRYMEEGGVDPARLIFAEKLPIEEHLNRLRLADLMLDTFPYGAHTTCSDALRMGLPVVTLMGQSFASRVAASLLTTVGLPELIATSLSDYESLAIELATNSERLADIRARLQRNFESTPLFNPELFARNLESLYETMYQRYTDGLAPDHIKVRH